MGESSYLNAYVTGTIAVNSSTSGSSDNNNGGSKSTAKARSASRRKQATNGTGSGGSFKEIFYSYNQGLVHYIGFSADAYTYRSGSQMLANQLAFMKSDLAKVDRKVTPWVVALVHKDFDMEGEAYADIYPVLDAGNVDLLFCGHIH